MTTAFSCTAEFYLRYRPAYPDALLHLLRTRAGTTGHGVLVDLGCGPGRVAIPLASHFERVVAVDVEPEMIAVADQAARSRGITNVEWRVARAELLELPAQSVELITIGEAFHRLDQPRVLGLAGTWLTRGGAIPTLGGEPVWRGPEPCSRRFLCSSRRRRQGSLRSRPSERATPS